MDEPDHTRELLLRWHAGDGGAIEALLRRDLPWIRDFVSQRLGSLLRGRAETQDYVQDAMLEVLRYCPRFLTGDRIRFRALLARIIENRLRDAHDYHAAACRNPARELAPSESVLDLDQPCRAPTEPGTAAERREQEAWVRLAIELLEPEDREVLLLREWQGLDFAAIGARLGIGVDAARFRFQRALPRLAAKLGELHAGAAPEPA